jgi:hypothetical protein
MIQNARTLTAALKARRAIQPQRKFPLQQRKKSAFPLILAL